MQGIKTFIPTERKITYLNMLLNCNFDTLDFGSFVSPKAIPQMQDTAKVLEGLNFSRSNTKLLAIIANQRGAKEACKYDPIQYLGYPFSISETFQMRNTHKTIEQSLVTLKQILEIASQYNKEVIVYLSMGFGNPYGEIWNEVIVANWTETLYKLGVCTISISDTVGTSKPETIKKIYKHLIPKYPTIEFGAHLHTSKTTWHEKLDAAYEAGCRRFDGAIQGFGGCPMASDALVGNMPTEQMISYFTSKKQTYGVNTLAFESAYNNASQLFKKFH